jgi:hypothetical protein
MACLESQTGVSPWFSPFGVQRGNEKVIADLTSGIERLDNVKYSV